MSSVAPEERKIRCVPPLQQCRLYYSLPNASCDHVHGFLAASADQGLYALCHVRAGPRTFTPVPVMDRFAVLLHTHTHTHAHAHTHTHTHMRALTRAHVRTRPCPCPPTRTHPPTLAATPAYLPACTHARMRTHTHTHRERERERDTETQIHTHTHTHTITSSSRPRLLVKARQANHTCARQHLGPFCSTR